VLGELFGTIIGSVVVVVIVGVSIIFGVVTDTV